MPLKLNDVAPEFDLPGVDGKRHSLKSLAGKKALAVIFSCNHCPYVQAYEDRIIALQKEFGPREFQTVAINSNEDRDHPEDSFDNMVKRAQDKKFNFLYLRDETQSVARAYGATHTPHIYLFDADRRLRYTGKIDDHWQDPARAKRHFLREAIEAVLGGKPVPEPETFAIGCTIKWK